MKIILPIVIFVSWFAFVLVPAGKLAIEDARNNVPNDKRRGTSILPGFPLFPLIAWGVAIAVDYFFPPWGSWTFLGIHGVLLVISLSIIIRDGVRLKRIRT
jgi:hypothetical protein